MSLQEIKLVYKQKLVPLYESIEINSLFTMAAEYITKWDSLQQVLHKSDPLTDLQKKGFDDCLEALLSEKPIQYIIGTAWFMGKPFTVNPQVLIPRPETEELVEWIIEYVQILNKPMGILDIGTGSGCIAISLKNNLPECSLTAIDISEPALNVAKLNASNLGSSVEFIQEDILKTTSLPDNFDIIVSNPPYIPFRETANMQAQVKKFEPSIALFVTNEDPLIFYRNIARLGKQYLNKNGQLFFEIHYDQRRAILALFKELGYHAEIKKDIYGNDRMLRASLM
jgi:release factor glutamine methyltransferase